MSDLIKDAYKWIDDGACDVYNEPGEAMADFAQSDRNTIAARLEALSQDTDVDDLVKAVVKFCDELRGKSLTNSQ